MTSSEKQEIVNEVLEAIAESSVKITDLTAVTDFPANSYLELSGGKKIASSDLINAVIGNIPDEGQSTIDYSSQLESGTTNYIDYQQWESASTGTYYTRLRTNASGESNVSKAISVQKGDIIVFTGKRQSNYPAIVGFNEEADSAEQNCIKYIYDPQCLLGSGYGTTHDTKTTYNNEKVTIPAGISKIRCCAYGEGRDGAPRMQIILKRGTAQQTSFSTKAFIPDEKKIIIAGASFVYNGGAADWSGIVATRTGIDVVLAAAAGSSVIGNLAARLMFRSATVSGTTKQMAHGLVFGEFSGSTYVDHFYEYGLLIINHTHNYDVYSLGMRGGEDTSGWSADDYETYFEVVPGNGLDFTSLSSWEQLNNITNTAEVGTSAWNVKPKAATGDTIGMTRAEAFDYSIKRIQSWCSELDTTGSYDYPKNTMQILITSHWNPGRVTYNNSSRQLAGRNNVAYCELDKMLGFVAGDDVTYDDVVCNRSRLHCSDTTDSQAEDASYKNWGLHPQKTGAWIQPAWAEAIISCLNYNPNSQSS